MRIRGEEDEIKAVFHTDGQGYCLIVGEMAETSKDPRGRTWLMIMGTDRDRIFEIKSVKKLKGDVWLCRLEGASILIVRTPEPRVKIDPRKLYKKYA